MRIQYLQLHTFNLSGGDKESTLNHWGRKYISLIFMGRTLHTLRRFFLKTTHTKYK
nr:MAG TPA: hypothetical protein [Caudoviricetes sp.]